MASAVDSWEGFSSAQKREIKTAIVVVALAPFIHRQIPSITADIKAIVRSEMGKIEKSGGDEHVKEFLQEILDIPATAHGLEELEGLQRKAQNKPELIKIALPIVLRAWSTLPSALQFSGFGELIKQNAVSKMVHFIEHWHYSGHGFEPPKGMSEPFSGYDTIINALMGHPKCKAELEKQVKAWERAQKAS